MHRERMPWERALRVQVGRMVPTRKGVRTGGGGGIKVPDNAHQTQEWAQVQPPARDPRDQDWAAGMRGRDKYSLDPRRLRARPGH